MHAATTFTVLASLAAFTAAQGSNPLANVPQCAQSCFTSAASQASQCSLLDSYCQCTTGREAITEALVSCLCTSTCNESDLAKVQQVSNQICSSALSASGETYTPTSVGASACQSTGGAAGGSGSSGSMSAPAASASATESMSSMDMNSMSSSAAAGGASASESVAQQSGNAAPAVTGMPGLKEAVAGAIGLGLMAL